jgi:hypothetical protein
MTTLKSEIKFHVCLLCLRFWVKIILRRKPYKQDDGTRETMCVCVCVRERERERERQKLVERGTLQEGRDRQVKEE